MNLPIIEVRFNANMPNDFYKVKIDHKFVWIDASKFDKEVLHVDGDTIVCKEPFDEYFRVTKNSNQKGIVTIFGSPPDKIGQNESRGGLVSVTWATDLAGNGGWVHGR